MKEMIIRIIEEICEEIFGEMRTDLEAEGQIINQMLNVITVNERTGHIAKYFRSKGQGHNAFQGHTSKINPALPHPQHYTNPKRVELCKTIAPMNVTESCENTCSKFSEIDQLYWPFITQGTVKVEHDENIPMNILRDTGSLQSLVRASIMSN